MHTGMSNSPACFEHVTGAGVDGDRRPGGERGRLGFMTNQRRCHLQGALRVLQTFAIERGAVKAVLSAVMVCWFGWGCGSGHGGTWGGGHRVLLRLKPLVQTRVNVVNLCAGSRQPTAITIITIIGFSNQQGRERRIVWTKHTWWAGFRPSSVCLALMDVIRQSFCSGSAVRRPCGMPVSWRLALFGVHHALLSTWGSRVRGARGGEVIVTGLLR